MRPFLFSLVVLGLLGCQSPMTKRKEAWEERLNSWVGADVNNLIGSWGPPTSTYDLPNGNRIYTWERSSQGAVAMPLYGGGAVARSFTRGCSTNMTADTSGRIVNWQYSGNACF
jgi:hypothetical protein